MAHLRRHGPHKLQSARHKLRESRSLHVLEALDLLLIACEEARRGLACRFEPTELPNQRQSLSHLKHLAADCKRSLLEGLKAHIKQMAENWSSVDEPLTAMIGRAMATGDWSKICP